MNEMPNRIQCVLTVEFWNLENNVCYMTRVANYSFYINHQALDQLKLRMDVYVLQTSIIRFHSHLRAVYDTREHLFP